MSRIEKLKSYFYPALKIFIVIGVFSLPLINLSDAKAARLKDILGRPAAFDGKVIEVKGEAIGNALKGKDGVWINILSRGENLGIFFSDRDLVKKIKYWGGYKKQGDYLTVKGTFYKHCPLHQERDLHGKSIEIIRRGFLKKEAVDPFKINLVKPLFLTFLVLSAVYCVKLWKKK